MFSQNTDLSLSGSTYKDYTVTMTGTAGNVTPVQGQASFNLRIKNPCIDSSFLTVKTTALPTGLFYILYAYKPSAKYEFIHDAFVIDAGPAALAICGDLTYTVLFNSAPIGETSLPLSYHQVSRRFSIYSEDFALVGPRTIEVKATLTNYPTVSSPAPNI